MSEADFQRQVIDLARLLDWEYVHFRAARTDKGWAVPVEGSLGTGWPDLVLVRGARIIFVELKSDIGRVSPAQARVIDALDMTPAEVFVWRPRDFDKITRILR